MMRSSGLRLLVIALSALAPLTLGSVANAANWNWDSVGAYSNAEGPLAPDHDDEMERLRRRHFLDERGEFSPARLQAAITHFRTRRAEVAESVRMSKKLFLIAERNYSEERAEADSADDDAVLNGFDLFTEGAEALLSNYSTLSAAALRDEVERLAIFASTIETIRESTIFDKEFRAAATLARGFYRVPREGALEASNLVRDGRLQSASELSQHRASGGDLSELNPPESAFWLNNAVEEYDPRQEEYLGEKFFPPEGTEFTYERMGSGQIKIKATYTRPDSSKKEKVTLRVGDETGVSILTAHLARAVGFPAVPWAHRKTVKLKLGAISYERFQNEWDQAHGAQYQGSPRMYIERYLPEENAVILKNVAIEDYAGGKKYKEIGAYYSGRNGYTNRREYRAQLIYAALIMLGDTNDIQLRADAYKDKETGAWRPLLFTADTGYAMGFFGATPNDYDWNVAERSSGGVTLKYFMSVGIHPSAFRRTSFSDARWILRRYQRLTDAQIDAMAEVAGLPAPVADLLVAKFKSRLNGMLDAFELPGRRFSVPTPAELHARHGAYIDSQGRLTVEAENYPGNTVRWMNTARDFATVQALNLFNQAVTSIFSLRGPALGLGDTTLLGEIQMPSGPVLSGNRRIVQNLELGPVQRRYLVEDSFTFSVPIGISGSIQLPVGAFYHYQWSYYHSYDSLERAGKAPFFRNLNPWAIHEIRRKLGPGEAIRVVHSAGTSLGTVKLSLARNVGASLSLFGRDHAVLKEVYLSRATDDILDALVTDVDETRLRNGFELSAFLKVAFSDESRTVRRKHKLYHFDLSRVRADDADSFQAAYRAILENNDFSLADRVAKSEEITDTERERRRSATLALWSRNSSRSTREIEILQSVPNPGDPDAASEDTLARATDVQDYNSVDPATRSVKLVLMGANFESSSRSLSDLWTPALAPPVVTAPLNYFGQTLTEALSRKVSVEALASDDTTSLAELQVAIDLQRIDNRADREEYEKDFLRYFNQRATPKYGRDHWDEIAENYLTLPMPEGVEAFSPLVGYMHWRISSAGARKFVAALKDPAVLKEIAFNTPTPWYKARNDQPFFDGVKRRIEAFEAKVDPTLPYEKKKEILRGKVAALSELFRVIIGTDSKQLGWLRRWIPESELWLVTHLYNPLEYSIPAALRKVQYFAPEVGQYPGQTYLERFRLEHRLRPELFYSGIDPLQSRLASPVSIRRDATLETGLISNR